MQELLHKVQASLWLDGAFPETQTESGDVAEAEGNSLQTTETALSTLLN